ncbi:MAG: gliding motility-associated C-terminal domain-containing protein [Bacteroidetes bacterium]|nr:gliding motility-associated C-terminal domain-containing protein [Bacteroidota bacterium]
MSCINLCAPTNNLISASQNICQGEIPDTLTGNTPTGGSSGGLFTYLWQVSTNGGSSWTNAPAPDTNPEYCPGITQDTTWYRRIVDPGSCQSISNTVVISVVRSVYADAGDDIEVCEGEVVTLMGVVDSIPDCTEPVTPVNVSLSTELWAVEVIWWITGENGDTVMGVFGPNLYEDYQSYFYTDSFAPGIYTLHAYDSYGDGWNDALIDIIPDAGTPVTGYTLPVCGYPGCGATVDFTVDEITGPCTPVYNWSGPAGFSSSELTPSLGSVNSSNTGIYTLTVAVGNGCPATDNMMLTVYPDVDSSWNAPAQVCENDSPVNLDALVTGTAGGTWSSATPGAVSGNYFYPSGLSGNVYITYTVGVTGCQKQSEQVITVISAPAALITGVDSVCPGNSVTLTATGGSTFIWTTGETTATITITPDTTTSYSVTVTNINGCTDTAGILVAVTSSPFAVISGDTALCEGGSITLTASGGTDYIWSTGESVSAVIVSPISDTTYYVTVTLGSCSDITGTTISVYPAPVADISGNNTVCEGDTTVLTAGGGSSYLWSSGDTTATVELAPVITSVFFVTVTSLQGCSSADSIMLTVNPLPLVVILGDDSICAGEQTVLTASGGTEYSWNTGQSAEIIADIPTATTTYVVTVTDNGCSATDSLPVTVFPFPVASITGNMQLCQGDSTVLSAWGGSTFQWSNGSTDQTITVSPASGSAYAVTVYENGCPDIATSAVIVNPLPAALITGDSTVCEGDTVILTASGGTVYTWSTGGTGETLAVQPGTTTLYSVTVSDNTCTDTTNHLLTVYPEPEVQITGDTVACEGDTVILTAFGGQEYYWNTGETSGTLTISSLTTQTYSVTVSSDGCTNSAAHHISVYPVPVVTIDGDSVICEGSHAFLSASGGSLIWWSTGDTLPEITVSPAITTSFTAFAEQNGCPGTADFLVTVYPVPVISITGNNVICEGETTTLTASGGTGYTWSTGEYTPAIQVGPLFTTTYYNVTVTQGICQSNEWILVIVNEFPVAEIEGDTTACEGETVALIASGGSQFEWSNGGTTGQISVTVNSDTTVYVTVTENGCQSSASHTIITWPLPAAGITGDSTVCDGNSLVLTADGGTEYLWNTSATTSYINITPVITTTYFVTVYDSHCENSAFHTVTVVPLPDAVISGDTSVCQGDTAILTASGGSEYLWSSGLTGAQLSVAPDVTTGYSVTVTESGCSSSNNFILTVLLRPEGEITGNDTICSGDETNIIIILQGVPPWNLTYTDGIITQQSTGLSTSPYNIVVSPVITTEYTLLTITDASGCQAQQLTGTAEIIVFEMPVADAGQDTEVCGLTALTAAISSSGAGLWTVPPELIVPEQNEPISEVISDAYGTYVLIWTETNGICSDQDAVSITFIQEPGTAYAGEDQRLDYRFETQMNALFPDTGTGSWSVSTGVCTVSDTTDPSTAVTGLQYGETILRWTVRNGVCPDKYDDVHIIVNQIFVPEGFSPNGDNVNDCFVIPGIENGESEVVIFNRWGNKVFRAKNYRNDWNGTNRSGNDLPDDTYYYIVRIDDLPVYRGYVVIKR